MSLLPGWDGRSGSLDESRSPKGALSSSASLNAAIQAKKQAERRSLDEKAAVAAARAAANKPIEEAHVTGWWATVDDHHLNDVDRLEGTKAAAGFAPQFGLTGQKGIGSSMFNIQRAGTSPPEGAAPQQLPGALSLPLSALQV